MALIKCPECGKEISDQAENCPNCGYPIKNQSTNNVNNNQQNSNKLNDSQKTIVALNKKNEIYYRRSSLLFGNFNWGIILHENKHNTFR